MKVTNAAAHLGRLGDESSGVWRKAREAVDAIAMALVKYAHAAGKDNGQDIPLPRRYTFECWPSGEWELKRDKGPQRLLDDSFKLTEKLKPAESLFRFAEDVSSGWLDEVVEILLKEAAKLNRFTSRVDTTLKATQT